MLRGKRIIATLLVVAMTFTTPGVNTFASSLSNLLRFYSGAKTTSAEEVGIERRYYEQMKKEQVYLLNDGDTDFSSMDEKLNNNDSTSKEDVNNFDGENNDDNENNLKTNNDNDSSDDNENDANTNNNAENNKAENNDAENNAKSEDNENKNENKDTEEQGPTINDPADDGFIGPKQSTKSEADEEDSEDDTDNVKPENKEEPEEEAETVSTKSEADEEVIQNILDLMNETASESEVKAETKIKPAMGTSIFGSGPSMTPGLVLSNDIFSFDDSTEVLTITPTVDGCLDELNLRYYGKPIRRITTNDFDVTNMTLLENVAFGNTCNADESYKKDVLDYYIANYTAGGKYSEFVVTSENESGYVYNSNATDWVNANGQFAEVYEDNTTKLLYIKLTRDPEYTAYLYHKDSGMPFEIKWGTFDATINPIVYDLDDGDWHTGYRATMSYVVGETIELPTLRDVDKDGYILDYWSIGGTRVERIDSTYTDGRVITVTLNWRPDEIDVNYLEAADSDTIKKTGVRAYKKDYKLDDAPSWDKSGYSFWYWVDKDSMATISEIKAFTKSTPSDVYPVWYKNVGTSVDFGTYPQNSENYDDVQPIKWKIVDISEENNAALLVSEKLLDSQNTYAEVVNFINNSFYNKAFTDADKALIHSEVINGKGGSPLFILSGSEFQSYRTALGGTLVANTTAYSGDGSAYYYFTSDTLSAQHGFIRQDGVYVVANDGLGRGIRPAVWVDLSALEYGREYKINWELDGADWNSYTPAKTYISGVGIDTLPDVSNLQIPDGVNFAGWELDGSFVTNISSNMTGDITLTAKWGYKINYYETAVATSIMKTDIRAYDRDYTYVPWEKTGYTFAYWVDKDTNTNITNTQILAYSKTTPSNIYPVWTHHDDELNKDVEYGREYKITFDPTEGNFKTDFNEPKTYISGIGINALPNGENLTTTTDKKFAGWKTGTTYLSKIEKDVTGDIDFVGKWGYDINYYERPDTTTIRKTTVRPYDEDYTLDNPASWTKDGYAFDYWMDKDKNEKISEIKANTKASASNVYPVWYEGTVGNFDVGYEVKFGTYPQDSTDANNLDDINWKVLSVDTVNDKVLIISDKVLYKRMFSDTYGGRAKNYNNSPIKTWLNETFANAAFSTAEKEAIVDSNVFILSASDANNYFSSNDDRKAFGTTYIGDTSTSTWWLSDVYDDGIRAKYVDANGKIINSTGEAPSVDDTCQYMRTYGVRPAMWVKISKLKGKEYGRQYKVTWDTTEGRFKNDYTKIETYVSGDGITKLPDATNLITTTDKYFAGWELNNVPVASVSEFVTGDITMVAKWGYKVNYYESARSNVIRKTDIRAYDRDYSYTPWEKEGMNFAYWVDRDTNTNIMDTQILANTKASNSNIYPVWSDGLNIADIGGTIEFGTYPQNSTDYNDVQPIEWTVLDKKDGKVLLVSKKILDVAQYDNSTGRNNTLEATTLGNFLTDTFYNKAFTTEEKKYILNEAITMKNTSGNNVTQNMRVFLLSKDDVDKYKTYVNNIENTTYSLSKNTTRSRGWWLADRSSAKWNNYSHYYSYIFDDDGAYKELFVTDVYTVRPAIWVDNSIIGNEYGREYKLTWNLEGADWRNGFDYPKTYISGEGLDNLPKDNDLKEKDAWSLYGWKIGYEFISSISEAKKGNLTLTARKGYDVNYYDNADATAMRSTELRPYDDDFTYKSWTNSDKLFNYWVDRDTSERINDTVLANTKSTPSNVYPVWNEVVNPGEIIRMGGVDWIVLEVDKDNDKALVISKNILKQVSSIGNTTDWFKYVREDYAGVGYSCYSYLSEEEKALTYVSGVEYFENCHQFILNYSELQSYRSLLGGTLVAEPEASDKQGLRSYLLRNRFNNGDNASEYGWDYINESGNFTAVAASELNNPDLNLYIGLRPAMYIKLKAASREYGRKYTISYDMGNVGWKDGHKGPEAYTSGVGITSLPDANDVVVPTDATFRGWTLNGQYVTSIPKYITGDITLKAKYYYTINYYENVSTDLIKASEARVYDEDYTLDTTLIADSGNYEFAYWVDKSTGEKISEIKANTMDRKCEVYAVKRYKGIEIGKTLEFGTYPQNSTDYDDVQPIQWKILDIDWDKNRVLLLSNNILDRGAYDDGATGSAWNNDTTVRKFLMGSFYNKAFNEDEKKLIDETKVGDYEKTTVFILSDEEYQKYSQELGINVGIAGRTTYSSNCSDYWIRNKYSPFAVYTYDQSGYKDTYAASGTMTYGYRPAMWIKLEDSIEYGRQYSVTWDLGQADWKTGFTPDKTYVSGTGLTSLPVASNLVPREDIKFLGWLLNKNEITSVSEYQVGNITIKAIWEYKVKYYESAKSSVVMKVATRSYIKDYTLDTEAWQKDGCTFVEWADRNTRNIVKDIKAFTQSSPSEVYPVWYKVATVGEIIKFGTYPQSNSESVEAIRWILLDVNASEKKALLLSEKVIDNSIYCTGFMDNLVWDGTELQLNLNGTFYNIAFNSEEKALLLPLNTSNSDDKGVTILTYEELESYKHILGGTLAAQGTNNNSNINSYWTKNLIGENSYGVIDSAGQYTYEARNNTRGVRPAIWVNLDAIGFEYGREYTIDYNLGAGSFINAYEPVRTYISGEGLDSLPASDKIIPPTDTAFSGWKLDNKYITYISQQKVGNITLDAKYGNYKVYYYQSATSEIPYKISVRPYDEDFNIDSTPVWKKDGYTFGRWIDKRTDELVTSTVIKANTLATSSYLYPLWNKGPNASSIGSTIKFGTYPQNSKDYNDVQPIEWIILDKEEDKTLLVSKYILDKTQYHDNRDTNAEWESLKIGAFLKETFYNKAFIDAEKNHIVTTSRKMNKSNGETLTKDVNIFLLNREDINKYSALVANAGVTTYVGSFTTNSMTNAWWIGDRSTTDGTNSAFVADSTTSWWMTDEYGVRPAIWVDNSLFGTEYGRRYKVTWNKGNENWIGDAPADYYISGEGIKTLPDKTQVTKPAGWDLAGWKFNNVYVSSISELTTGPITIDAKWSYNNYKEGDVIPLGNLNGNAIDWKIVGSDAYQNKVLLLSKDIIDKQKYSDKKYGESGFALSETWKDSTIRKWLNEDFLDTSLAYDIKDTIFTTNLKNTTIELVNQEINEIDAEDTNDKVFLFNSKDINTYLLNDKDVKISSAWWLRGPSGGYSESGWSHHNLLTGEVTWDTNASSFVASGSDAINVKDVETEYGIRPAVWVDITKVVELYNKEYDVTYYESALSGVVKKTYKRRFAEDYIPIDKPDWTNGEWKFTYWAEKNTYEKVENVKAYTYATNSEIYPVWNIVGGKVAVGEKVEFGTYPQASADYNAVEPITWTVLEVNDDKVLLLSDKVLDTTQYHSADSTILWDGNDGINPFLNNTFYNKAFTTKEQEFVIATRVEATEESKVFILSKEDIDAYVAALNGKLSLTAQSTTYSGTGDYWTLNATNANRGEVTSAGRYYLRKGTQTYGVRPAIWVSAQEFGRKYIINWEIGDRHWLNNKPNDYYITGEGLDFPTSDSLDIPSNAKWFGWAVNAKNNYKTKITRFEMGEKTVTATWGYEVRYYKTKTSTKPLKIATVSYAEEYVLDTTTTVVNIQKDFDGWLDKVTSNKITKIEAKSYKDFDLYISWAEKDYVLFGNYLPEHANPYNEQLVKWKIKSRDIGTNRVELLSYRQLARIESYGLSPWKDSAIRAKLNDAGGYYDLMFDDNEKSKIVTTTHDTVQDKLYVLSKADMPKERDKTMGAYDTKGGTSYLRLEWLRDACYSYWTGYDVANQFDDLEDRMMTLWLRPAVTVDNDIFTTDNRIKYNLDGGKWVDGYDVPYTYDPDGKFILPDKDKLSKEGYTLDCWIVNGVEKNEIDNEYMGLVYLKAKWKAKKYQVRYYATKNATTPIKIATRSFNEAYTLDTTTTETYEKHIFKGWRDKSDRKDLTTIEADTYARDIEVYTTWKKIEYIFGRYPQTSTDENSLQDIEWMAMAEDTVEDKVLFVSKYGLLQMPMDENHVITDGNESVPWLWSNSTLRTALNGNVFYNKAFNTEEKKAIINTPIRTKTMTDIGSLSGYMDVVYDDSTTNDNIFVLSSNEVKDYNVGSYSFGGGTVYSFWYGDNYYSHEYGETGYAWTRNAEYHKAGNEGIQKNHTVCYPVNYQNSNYPYISYYGGNKYLVYPALWAKLSTFNSNSIEWHLDGGDWEKSYKGSQPTTYVTDEGLTLPTADKLQKVGYTFDHWEIDGQPTTFIDERSEGKVDVYAVWKAIKVELEWRLDGGRWNDPNRELISEFDYDIGVPKLATRGELYYPDGLYRFKGWTILGSDTIVEKVEPFKHLTKVVLKAKWEWHPSSRVEDKYIELPTSAIKNSDDYKTTSDIAIAYDVIQPSDGNLNNLLAVSKYDGNIEKITTNAIDTEKLILIEDIYYYSNYRRANSSRYKLEITDELNDEIEKTDINSVDLIRTTEVKAKVWLNPEIDKYIVQLFNGNGNVKLYDTTNDSTVEYRALWDLKKVSIAEQVEEKYYDIDWQLNGGDWASKEIRDSMPLQYRANSGFKLPTADKLKKTNGTFVAWSVNGEIKTEISRSDKGTKVVRALWVNKDHEIKASMVSQADGFNTAPIANLITVSTDWVRETGLEALAGRIRLVSYGWKHQHRDPRAKFIIDYYSPYRNSAYKYSRGGSDPDVVKESTTNAEIWYDANSDLYTVNLFGMYALFSAAKKSNNVWRPYGIYWDLHNIILENQTSVIDATECWLYNTWYEDFGFNTAKENITSIHFVKTYNRAKTIKEEKYIQKSNGVYLARGIIESDGTLFVMPYNNDIRLLATEDASHFFGKSRKGTFKNVTTIDGLNIIIWDDTKKMNNMFSGCEKLISVDLTKINTYNVVSMMSMFENCQSLTVLDLSGFDIKKVQNMTYMFDGMRRLHTIYVGANNFDTSNVLKSVGMFRNDGYLVGGEGSIYDPKYIDSTYARIDQYLTNGTRGYFTLKGKTKITTTNYPIYWYRDGGQWNNYSEPQQYTYGEGLPLPTKKDIVKDGYVLDYWTLEDESGNITVTDNISKTMRGVVIIRAHWREQTTGAIRWEKHGGDWHNYKAVDTYIEGEGLYPLPNEYNIVKEGYDFVNWTIGGTVVDRISTEARGLVVLDANWQEKEKEKEPEKPIESGGEIDPTTDPDYGKEYEIKWELDGGEWNEYKPIEKYTYGEGLKTNEFPTAHDIYKEDHKFEFWTLNSPSGGVIASISKTQKGKLTIYASWSEVTPQVGITEYPIKWTLNGGTWYNIDPADLETYTYGVGMTLPGKDNIVKDGWNFVGWTIGGAPATEISKTQRGRVEVVANWESKSGNNPIDEKEEDDNYTVLPEEIIMSNDDAFDNTSAKGRDIIKPSNEWAKELGLLEYVSDFTGAYEITQNQNYEGTTYRKLETIKYRSDYRRNVANTEIIVNATNTATPAEAFDTVKLNGVKAEVWYDDTNKKYYFNLLDGKNPSDYSIKDTTTGTNYTYEIVWDLSSAQEKVTLSRTWYEDFGFESNKENITSVHFVTEYNGTKAEIEKKTKLWNVNAAAYSVGIIDEDGALYIISSPSTKLEVEEDASNFFGNTRKGTFKNVTTIEGIGLLDFSKSTNMSSMFSGAENIEELDISELDITSATDMSFIFKDMKKLETIYVDNFDTTNVTMYVNMFDGCVNIIGAEGTTYDKQHRGKDYARIDKKITSNLPGYFTAVGTTKTYTSLEYNIDWNLDDGDWEATYKGTEPTKYEYGVGIPTLPTKENVVKAGFELDAWSLDGIRISSISTTQRGSITLKAEWAESISSDTEQDIYINLPEQIISSKDGSFRTTELIAKEVIKPTKDSWVSELGLDKYDGRISEINTGIDITGLSLVRTIKYRSDYIRSDKFDGRDITYVHTVGHAENKSVLAWDLIRESEVIAMVYYDEANNRYKVNLSNGNGNWRVYAGDIDLVHEIEWDLSNIDVTEQSSGNAKEEYDITWIENGGKWNQYYNKFDKYEYGKETVLPKEGDISKEGYKFLGWKYNGSDIATISSTMRTNITLIAGWKLNRFKVTLDADGGVFDDNKSTRETTIDGGSIVTFTEPTKTGYNFAGWVVKENGVKTALGEYWTYESGKTVTATWTPIKYRVIFDGDGADNPYVMVPYALDMTYGVKKGIKENLFERDGYTFNKWTSTNGYMVYDGDEISTIGKQDGEEVVLKAEWVPKNIMTDIAIDELGKLYVYNRGERMPVPYSGIYSLTDFEENYVEPFVTGRNLNIALEILNKYKGKSASYIQKQIQKQKLEFIGWQDETGKFKYLEGTKFDQTTQKYKATESLIAKLVRSGDIIGKVKFDGNGGKVAGMDKCEITVTRKDTKLEDIEPLVLRPGYTFKGWTISGGRKFDFEEVLSDLEKNVVTATWDPMPYVLAYNANDGTTKVSGEDLMMGANDDKTVKSVADLGWEREGYKFNAWAFNRFGQTTRVIFPTASYSVIEHETKVLNSGEIIKNNIYKKQYPLYARWEPLSKAILYNIDGEYTKVYEATYGKGQKLIENTATKNGFKFVGWITKNGAFYTDRQDVNTILVNEKSDSNRSIELFPKWELDKDVVQVTYKGNGGAVNGALSYTIWVKKSEGIRPIEAKKGTQVTTSYIDKNGNPVNLNKEITEPMIIYADFGNGIETLSTNTGDTYKPLTADEKKIPAAEFGDMNDYSLKGGAVEVVNLSEEWIKENVKTDVEDKPEDKPSSEDKPEDKPSSEDKPEDKPSSEDKPEDKSDDKPSAEPENKPNVNPDPEPENKPNVNPEPEVKPTDNSSSKITGEVSISSKKSYNGGSTGGSGGSGGGGGGRISGSLAMTPASGLIQPLIKTEITENRPVNPLITPVNTANLTIKSVSGKSAHWEKDKTTGKYTLVGYDKDNKEVKPVNTFCQIVNENGTDTYYFDKDGNMLTGWMKTMDGKWYYFNEAKGEHEGKMAQGWLKVGNSWYYFTPNGSLLEYGLTPDGEMIGKDGKWAKDQKNEIKEQNIQLENNKNHEFVHTGENRFIM